MRVKRQRLARGAVVIPRRVSLVVVIALTIAASAAPASAGPARGAMVEYDLVFPVDGAVRYEDTFGAARAGHSHEGQDLLADKGIPVVAASSGTIRFVNWSTSNTPPASRCCSLVLDHEDGWQTRYLHLDNDSPGTDDGAGWGVADGIVPGASVAAGQVIGWVGDSGNAEGSPAHLHFELRDPNGIAMNPFAALVAAEPTLADGPLFEGGALVRRGARGDVVHHLQEVLIELGYDPGPLDGIFGSGTDRAVIAFQTDNGLDVDGIVGSASRRAMLDLLRPLSVVRRGDRGADVTYLQERLGQEGFNPGPVDGIFGSLTHGAVTDFQRARALVVDGIVGNQTWTSLRLR